jgi:hypothetical protein
VRKHVALVKLLTFHDLGHHVGCTVRCVVHDQHQTILANAIVCKLLQFIFVACCSASQAIAITPYTDGLHFSSL